MNAISANDLGLSAVNLNRRQFFAGATVAVAMNGPVAAAVPAPVTVAELAGQWLAAHRNWIKAAEAPEAENFDTPECLHWAAVRDELEEAMQKVPLRGLDDVRAILRFVWQDSSADYDASPSVPKWALRGLMEWAGTP